jgi:ABC-type lipoprotein export system ATPase subunit
MRGPACVPPTIVMPESLDPVVQILDVRKDYHGLRPLRVRQLEIRQGQSLALLGFDGPMAEVLVNLLTGGSVPDSGTVIVFGEPTSTITDRTAWLKMLDHFGLVSDRAVLLEQLTAEQNLAIPLSLAVESMSHELRTEVRRLAAEVGFEPSQLSHSVAQLDAPARVRIRLGRALALNPRMLLAEHPTATLSPTEALALADDLSRIRRERNIASLVLTADRQFARAAADEVLTLQPATGELKSDWGWRRWM